MGVPLRENREGGVMGEQLTWQKECPRKSGWYWVRQSLEIVDPPGTPNCPFESIMEVESRDETEDGWVWVNDADRIYLTPRTRSEDGDNYQDDNWMTWEWAGPIPEPREEP